MSSAAGRAAMFDQGGGVQNTIPFGIETCLTGSSVPEIPTQRCNLNEGIDCLVT